MSRDGRHEERELQRKLDTARRSLRREKRRRIEAETESASLRKDAQEWRDEWTDMNMKLGKAKRVLAQCIAYLRLVASSNLVFTGPIVGLLLKSAQDEGFVFGDNPRYSLAAGKGPESQTDEQGVRNE